jgi:hypothetical protein
VVRGLVSYLRGLKINLLLRWQLTPSRCPTVTGIAMNMAAALAASVQQGDDESTVVPVSVSNWLSCAWICADHVSVSCWGGMLACLSAKGCTAAGMKWSTASLPA